MPTERIYSSTFLFQDALSRKGECGLALYRLESGAYVAIATDLDKGPSITNAAEEIATQVKHQVLDEGDALLWVEHYRYSPFKKAETYDKVVMRWDGQRYVDPEREHLTRAEVAQLIDSRVD